jgi:T5SS/PEP-CTERM-associated repeat protein
MRKLTAARVVQAITAASLPLLWTAAGQAQVAADIYWVHEGNAPFHQPSAWDPPQVPGPEDAAHFNLPDLDYVVNFTLDATTRQLRVHDGRPMFELGGRTYTVTEADENEFSVIVGTGPVDYARLILLNGTLESQRSLIGRDQWSNGIVRVEAGGVWDTTEELIVGRDGSGELNILQGGQVTSRSGAIGERAGSTGHVLVSGPGSLWELKPIEWWGDFYSYLHVGVEGQGALEINQGGLVLADSGMTIGSGSVTVSGAGSTLESTDRRGIIVASGGTLDVTDGGVVQMGPAQIYGTATVSGMGSHLGMQWSQDFTLQLEGELNLLDGGSARGTDGYVDGGFLNVDGGSLQMWGGSLSLFNESITHIMNGGGDQRRGRMGFGQQPCADRRRSTAL